MLRTKLNVGNDADRGYFDGEEILACEEADVAVTLPKPMTSNAKAEGRFGNLVRVTAKRSEFSAAELELLLHRS